MEVFPKFIIENDKIEGDVLIISKSTFHKQLANDTEKVKGGGWWSLDRKNSIFTLYGKSEDFGKATYEDVKNCVLNKKVFNNRYFTQNISEKFKFLYEDSNGEFYNLN